MYDRHDGPVMVVSDQTDAHLMEIESNRICNEDKTINHIIREKNNHFDT